MSSYLMEKTLCNMKINISEMDFDLCMMSHSILYEEKNFFSLSKNMLESVEFSEITLFGQY